MRKFNKHHNWVFEISRIYIIIDTKNLNQERYTEEYDEGSELIWPSDKEDKVTRKFYSNLSRLKKNTNSNNTKRLNFFELLIKIINLKKF